MTQTSNFIFELPTWTDGLSPDSPIWVFASSRKFTSQETLEIENLQNEFCKQWNAHGHSLAAYSSVFQNQFLIFTVDNKQSQASGCSIDSLTYFVKKISANYSIDLFNRLIVYYVENETIKSCPQHETRELIKNNQLKLDTIIFQNFVHNIEQLKNTWQVEAKDSYIQTMF